MALAEKEEKESEKVSTQWNLFRRHFDDPILTRLKPMDKKDEAQNEIGK